MGDVEQTKGYLDLKLPPARGSAVVAILIPCHNEELTIANVVSQFMLQLPGADIYVFDNNSTDDTVNRARSAGAKVFFEARQGKGYVVQSMFREIDADVYVIVDGDGTYPAADVHRLVDPILADLADMTVGSRLHKNSSSQFKSVNRFGNRLFLSVLKIVFNVKITDMLSGYRAFNRAFLKGIPLFGGGFEIETEMTIKALQRGYRILEVPINLGSRPDGSSSKIRILRDGMRILNTMLALCRDYKPLTFFGAVGLFAIILGLIPGMIVALDFLRTGLVVRLPSAVLAVALVLSGMLSLMVGVILHTIARRSQELEAQLRIVGAELNYQMKLQTAQLIKEHRCGH